MTAGANLAAVIQARAAAGGWSGDVAFVVGDRVFTHGEIHEGAARAGSLLIERGVGPGDRVLIVLADSVEFVWAFLGAIRIGAIAVPVNPRLTIDDHSGAAAHVRPAVVVCAADIAGRFDATLVVDADALEAALVRWPPCPLAPVGGADAAYAQFTSGTTGPPKVAVHAHRDPLVYVDAFARPAVGLTRADVVLSVSKLYFAYGLGNSLFFPLLVGCRAVLHPAHPQPQEIADLVRRHGVTALFAVPTFFAHLVAERLGALPSVRVAVSAGEALSESLAVQVRSLVCAPVLDGLGSTEVGQTFASNTLEMSKDGTVGRVLPPYRVCVRDDTGREVAAGTAGGLWVAGPTLLTGYIDAVSGAVVARTGEWLETGDLATIDDQGFLRLRGRADDLELVGGILLAPAEIEAVISRHRDVVEVAVAGVVGPDGASRLEAFVVARRGAGTIGDELLAMARTELAAFKVPRSVHLVCGLPRTPTGKLQRHVLRTGTWPPQAPARAPNRSR